MTGPLRVLLIEDSEDDAFLLERELRRGGFEPTVTRVDEAKALAAALAAGGFDIVITDHNLPGFSSNAAMGMIRDAGLDVPVIIVSGTIGEDSAVAAMKAGASDYIMKGHMARLVPAIERELRDAALRREHRKAEATIHHMAFHDALTGLANRHQFEQRLARSLSDAQANGRQHALLYLDLDQFKVVNDTCGHLAGDHLLRHLSHQMAQKIRESDLLARLGGDEFGVLLEHCPLEQAQKIAGVLLRAINTFRFVWSGKSFSVGGSIGVVPITASSAGVADLLRNADVACYAAKDLGRNRFHVYHPDDIELTRRHGEMQWVSRINQALEQGRFTLFWQRIVSLEDAAACSCHEILLRMRGEDGELILPGTFLLAAERYNLAPAVDRWVVGRVLNHLVRYCRHGMRGEQLFFVNLSAATLGDEEFLEFIVHGLRQSGVPAACLCFEITETAAIANLDRAVGFIESIRAEGCRFALDDFGTGMSSFSYLKALPVDYLKIDGGFVRDIDSDPMSLAIVEAVNRVGHAVGLKTVAESVETRSLLETLSRVGVDYGQGFALHRPEPIARLE